MICSVALLSGSLSASAQNAIQGSPNDGKIDLGFGVEQSQKLSTSAVSIISGEELMHSGASRLSEALYGRLLGLTALSNGGFEGDENKGASLNVRGLQTLSQEGILILVDGYERPIDRITVEEVESVTVLKDAAAVAMLGHEGINGAILVKTKHGMLSEKNHIKVGYSHRFDFDPVFADLLNGEQYANALNKARANDGLNPAFSASEISNIASNANPFLYPNVNWKDEAFKNAAAQNDVNLTFYGGTDKLRYYAFADYSNTTGLFKNTKQENYDSQLRMSKANLRANMDYDITETTKMSVNIAGIFIETNRPNDIGGDDAVWRMYATPATAIPLVTSNGFWGGNETYGDASLVAKIQDTGYMKSNQRQLWANAKLTQNLDFWVKGLKAEIGAGYDNMALDYEQHYRAHQYGFDYIDANGQQQVMVYGNKQEQLKFNHWTDTMWRIAQAYAGLYYDTKFSENDNFSAAVVYNTKSEIRLGANNTFYRENWIGTAHYDLNNKFLADVVLALNGSNRSYPAKWAFSPTVALGYIFADNSEASILNFGKVRASAGIQHTDWVPQAGIWQDVWGGGNGTFYNGLSASGNGGTFITSFPTTNFGQQTAYKYNLGADFKLFNALDITADLFYQRRTNILQSANSQNSWVVGIQSGYDDYGSVESYGMEIGANFKKEIAKDLHLNIGAMMSYTQSKILKYLETPAFANLSHEGQKINEARGLQAIGFFTSQDDINNSPVQQFSVVQVGDIKYKDVNGDGLVNQNDVVGLGKSMDTPALNFAANIGLEYKGFGVNATLQGAGNYMKNLRSVAGVWNLLNENVMTNISTEYYNNSYDVAGAAAKYPRLTSQSNPNNEQGSSIWFKEINFIKLRNVEMFYHLPKAWIAPAKLSDVKVFVQGRNLFSSDNVSAMDAEVLSTAYPMTKSVNLGLSVTF